LSGSATIVQGQSTTIQATLAGVGPWQVTWSDTVGTTSTPVTVTYYSSPATRVVQPAVSTTYSLTAQSTAGGCPMAIGSPIAVTVTPPAPLNLTATATAPTQVAVSWTALGTTDRFDVYRDNAFIGSNTGSPYFDNGVAANPSHLYYVVAATNSVTSSASNIDLATTVIFAQDPLVTGVTEIAANHIVQLRTAVNAVRAKAGLAASTFTDSVLTGVEPKPAHINELRAGLDAARAVLGLPPVPYLHQPITTGDAIEAAHVMELRGGVQ
jgi:hypothetical protein